MRALGYLSEFSPRLLGAGAASAPLTLSEQNEAFLRSCDANGFEPAAAFLDTADDEARRGLQQLIDYLDRSPGGFVHVIVGAFAHLGPTPTEAVRAYFQLTGRGARVVSIAEGPLDEGRVLEQWRHLHPSADLRDRVRDAMRRRAVQGRVLGRPPYGYRVGGEGRLEIQDDEATLVRYMFHLCVREGCGIRKIVKRLNAEGYETRRGGNWSMVTIRDLLRNRVYVGTYARFGVKVPGNHPAIVSESDFHATQERMDRRRTAAPASRTPGAFLLSGLVYCGESGTRMIGVTRRQRWQRKNGEVASNVYRYYQSEARTNQSVGAYHTRRADALEAEVLAQLTGGGPGAVRPVLSAGNADAVRTETVLNTSRVRGRMRLLDRRLADELDRAADGRLTRDALRAAAQEIVSEFEDAADELTALAGRSEAQASDVARRQQRERALARIREEWDGLAFAERQAVLREVVDRVIVEAQGVRTVLRA